MIARHIDEDNPAVMEEIDDFERENGGIEELILRDGSRCQRCGNQWSRGNIMYVVTVRGKIIWWHEGGC